MSSQKNNLLVIGPGHLGARVATLWREQFPEAEIALKAHRQDKEREAKWQSLGFISFKEGSQYDNVLFSAPPGKYQISFWGKCFCFFLFP